MPTRRQPPPPDGPDATSAREQPAAPKAPAAVAPADAALTPSIDAAPTEARDGRIAEPPADGWTPPRAVRCTQPLDVPCRRCARRP